MNKDDYEILVNMSPAGRDGPVRPPDMAVKMLEDVCASTGLDWKRRHVYLMSRGGKWQVVLSIDGFRLIGAQHEDYAGQEGPFWVTAADGTWSDVPPEGKVYAAKVGVKLRNGTTTWGVAKFADYKAGPMWDKFPSTMSAKCAEMLAWRKALPGKLGGLYGTEEMEQAARGRRGKGGVDLVGEGKPGESAPEAPAVSGPQFAAYLLRVMATKSKAELRELGKAITGDKALSLEDTMELHRHYTERMPALPE